MLNDGRRIAMISMNIIGICGSLMSVIPNYFVLLIGRFLYCFSSGVLISAVPRIIEETIPFDKYDLGFGASTNLAIDFLILIYTIIDIYMPKTLNLSADPIPT